jgi:HAD superfamily hydrolase (TIGR01549 family)
MASPPPANGLRAILYDWDGTLVDSSAASYRSYVRVFGEFGIGFDEATYRRTYTPDWYRTYEAVGLAREHWPKADARWTEVYDEEASTLLPGVRDVLQRLAGRGLRQGLVSSGDGRRVRRELEAHGLRDFFGDAVVCGGDTKNRKPHPEPLLVALGRLGVAPGEAAYVGDSPEDVKMAQAAGVRAVGVPGGFPNREALAAARPDLLAPSLEGALDMLLGAPDGTAR